MATRKSSAPRTISALIARTQLGQIMERARKSRERFVVERNGEPVAVILGFEDYLENVTRDAAALARLQSESRRRGLDRLTLGDINQEIASQRSAKRKAR